MDDAMLNWDELSAEEIAKLLRNTSRPTGLYSTPFLDCHQWIPLARQPGWQATGGFPNAQFRCAHLDYHSPAISYWRLPAASVLSQGNSARSAGRLLRRTLPSGSLGDIYLAGDSLFLAALATATPALKEVKSEQLDGASSVPNPSQRTTAASMRLDAVVAAIFHVSREEAQRAIEYGFLFVNFTEAGKRSLPVNAGDQIVYRAKGRAQLLECGVNPRSKRHWLEFAVYLA